MSQKTKKLSQYGRELLNELSIESDGFRNGSRNAEFARTFSIMANSRSRAMQQTLNAVKFETTISKK